MIYQHASMLWPGLRTRALTFSYDDCVLQDIKLLELFNRNGEKATFNMNSGFFGQTDSLIREGRVVDHSHVRADEVAALYRGHEVAVHTVTHPNLCALADYQVIDEVIQDRRNLEELVHYPVRGMAYPGGCVDERVIGLLKGCGIVYSRAVGTTGKFSLPEENLNWKCSCHHWGLEPLIEPFLGEGDDLRLLSCWGHAYEFDQRSDWDVIERQLDRLGNHDDVWYATNIDVFDYIAAFKALDFTVDGRFVTNRSALDVCLRLGKKTLTVHAGETAEL